VYYVLFFPCSPTPSREEPAVRKICIFVALAALVVVAACTQTPLGPPSPEQAASAPPLRGSWSTLEAGEGIWIDPHGMGGPGVRGPDDDGGDPQTGRGGGALGSGT
jgi:hypothetical protein